MANIVETIFTSRDTGVVETIERINNKLPEIARAASAAATPVDQLEAKLRRLAAVADLYNQKIGETKFQALRSEGIPAVEALTEKILKAADAQRRLTAETKATADANRQVEAAVARVRAQQARTEIIRGQSSVTTREAQFSAPNAAAASALERTTQGFNKATEGASRLAKGSAELRQTLFSLSGVPYPEAANQLSKLLGGSMGGALAIAGIAAIGAVAVSVSQQVREQAEADLKRINALANLGLTGGLEKRGTEQERLEKVIQAAREARAIGQNPNQVVASQLATEVPENAIKKGAREAARIYTAIFNEDVARDLFGDPEKIFVGVKNLQEAELQLNNIVKQRQRIEEAIGEAQQKRLDTARAERKIQEGVVDHINQVFGAYQKESEEAEKARQKNRQGSESAVADLRIQLADNPYEKFFLQAQKQQEQFLDQWKDAAPQIKQEGMELIEQLRQIQNFRESLSRAGSISDLVTQRDTLGVTGGRNRQQQIGQERAGFVNSQFDNQLEIGRLQGRNISDADALWRRIQNINSSLGGRFAAEAIEQATRGLSLEQLDAAGVRNARIGAVRDLGAFQQEDFQRQQRIRRIEEESRDRQIAIANAGILSATSPEQKRLALEAGLAATKDSGNLTPSQIDAKVKFIDQSLQIQQEALRMQIEREERKLISDEKFTASVDKLAEILQTGVVKILIENGAAASVDLGQSFQTPVNSSGSNNY
jgi:hypothetical protein